MNCKKCGGKLTSEAAYCVSCGAPVQQELQEKVKEESLIADAMDTATLASPEVEALLKRASMFLEDGNFDFATKYYERILDKNPEEARAYVGKLMAEIKVRTESELSSVKRPLDCRENYIKALRFANEAHKAKLQSYNQAAIKESERLEAERKEKIYKNTLKFKEGKHYDELLCKAIIEKFGSIRGYKDADEQAEAALQLLHRLEKERDVKKARSKKHAVVFSSIIGGMFIAILVLIKVIIPATKYNKAEAMFDAGNYQEAAETFWGIWDYADSLQRYAVAYALVPKDENTHEPDIITEHVAGITYENFNRIQTGMTYSRVVEILGADGVLSSKADLLMVYQWSNSSSGLITIGFYDGKVSSVFQIGLG